MVRPSREDYGITEKDAEEHRKQEMDYTVVYQAKKYAHMRLCNNLGYTFLAVSLGCLIAGSVLCGLNYSDWVVAYSVLFGLFVLFVIVSALLFAPSLQMRLFRMPDRGVYIEEALDEKFRRFYKDRDEYRKYVRSLNSAYWSSLSWNDFRDKIAELFRKDGYVTTPGKEAGSEFVNIVLTGKDDEKIGVRCRSIKKKENIAEIVRFIRSVPKDSGLDKVYYITTNGYDVLPQTVYLAAHNKGFRIELWQMKHILSLALETNSIIFEDSEFAARFEGDRAPVKKSGIKVVTLPAVEEPYRTFAHVEADEIEVGLKVEHPELGKGTVTAVDKDARTILVKFKDSLGGDFFLKFAVPDIFDEGVMNILQK